MNELKKTLTFCAVAFALAGAAVFVDPGVATPDIFSDQGQPFYPAFTDPQAPRAIEVVDYDEATATARPLKVEFKGNRWSIPSHYGYPADAENRLANTAAALIGLRKDTVVSERVEDQARYGVVDPLDQNATGLAGRGKRVTLRDAKGEVLAELVFGKPVDSKAGYRYARIPGQRRTYAVKTDADISARFEDWIETDLLKLSASDIRKVTINNYSINEMEGTIENVDRIALTQKSGKWSSTAGALRDDRVRELADALDSLRTVDVQRKPENLTHDLKTAAGIRLSVEAILSLRGKGFFIMPDGQLLSNAGEIIVETVAGLQYTLRFGEIAGGGLPPGGGSGNAGGNETMDNASGERRYLFITVGYSDALAKLYAADGQSPDTRGKALAGQLRNRFADWYYVISGADFKKLHPGRKELLRG